MVIDSTTNAKDDYEAFSAQIDIPLFAQSWWLDIVCGGSENWNAAVIKKGDVIHAALPYYLKNKYGSQTIAMPPLCQVMGPYFAKTDAQIQKRLQREKELTMELIHLLPPYVFFKQNFHHSVDYWLPWHWQGFEQTTRYTYRIEDTSNEDTLWKNLSGNIRKEIKKSQSRFGVQVKTDLDGENIENFIDLNIKTFSRQNQKLPYSKQLLLRLDKVAAKKKQRRILVARDEKGAAHAGIYLVWDHASVYYLMGGGDPELRKSGATSLLMWEGIKLAHQQNKAFDFEGSMLEPIERFFRAFGGTPTPYFQVTKINDPKFMALSFGKAFLKSLLKKKH